MMGCTEDWSTCNCDWCRFTRFESNLVVKRIEIVPAPDKEQPDFLERCWKENREAFDNFLLFEKEHPDWEQQAKRNI